MRQIALVALLVAVPALAGPPAVCWPVEIGEAESLAKDTRHVVEDTLRLLEPGMPVLVRMETLRRATNRMDRSAATRDALLKELMVRVLDAEAAGQPSALAWFDAGYALGCLRQLGMTDRKGYPWVRKALSIRKTDPEMEYACAILTLMGDKEAFLGHLGRAADGAEKNPLLAKNLEILRERYPPVLEYFERRNKE